MTSHKVHINQLLPDGSVQEVSVDVLASCEDSALAMVFGWYDVQSHLDSERANLGLPPDHNCEETCKETEGCDGSLGRCFVCAPGVSE